MKIFIKYFNLLPHLLKVINSTYQIKSNQIKFNNSNQVNQPNKTKLFQVFQHAAPPVKN